MKTRGLSSMVELSRICSIHRNTLYPLMRGEIDPFNDSYLSVCRALDLDPVGCLSNVQQDGDTALRRVVASVYTAYKKRNPTLAFFLFGSRAAGTAKRFSDYDIGVTGGRCAIGGLEFLKIKESVLEQCDDLPVKVDILNFDSAPVSFLADFDSPLVTIAGSTESVAYLEGKIHGQSKIKAA